MAAPRKNKFAAKPLEEIHGETLFVRLRKSEKDMIAMAAAGLGLAAWAREVLVKAAEEKIEAGANNRVQPISLRSAVDG